MKVKIRLTGIYAQTLGWTRAEMALTDRASLSDLLAILAEQAGQQREKFFEKETGLPALDIITVVNGAASPGATVLHEGDVVTLMPPAVGGGPTATN